MFLSRFSFLFWAMERSNSTANQKPSFVFFRYSYGFVFLVISSAVSAKQAPRLCGLGCEGGCGGGAPSVLGSSLPQLCQESPFPFSRTLCVAQSWEGRCPAWGASSWENESSTQPDDNQDWEHRGGYGLRASDGGTGEELASELNLKNEGKRNGSGGGRTAGARRRDGNQPEV